MTKQESGKTKEYRRSFKNYDLVIDKGKVIAAIVIVIMIFLYTLFLFYLGDVFK